MKQFISQRLYSGRREEQMCMYSGNREADVLCLCPAREKTDVFVEKRESVVSGITYNDYISQPDKL